MTNTKELKSYVEDLVYLTHFFQQPLSEVFQQSRSEVLGPKVAVCDAEESSVIQACELMEATIDATPVIIGSPTALYSTCSAFTVETSNAQLFDCDVEYAGALCGFPCFVARQMPHETVYIVSTDKRFADLVKTELRLVRG